MRIFETPNLAKLIVGAVFFCIAVFYISMTAALQYHWNKYKVEGATMKGASIMYYTMTAVLLVILTVVFISFMYD